MSRSLPEHPSLDFLKQQAKELLAAARAGDTFALERLRAWAGVSAGAAAKLADAQRATAREYGFPSWTKLKGHVESQRLAEDPVAAFVEAVKQDEVAEARRLLARPAVAERINESLPGFPFGGTALIAAVNQRSRALVDLLLAHGADINQKSRWWAGGFGVLDQDDNPLAAYLIERGATVDAYAAARLGSLERLRALVAADPAAVHQRGGDGQTPLHVAATVEIAAFLLDHGADVDARDVDHESTPAQYLIRRRQDVVRYLIARGARTDILMAAALGDLAMVRAFLDADPDAIRTAVTREDFPMKNPEAGGSIYIWTLGKNKTAHLVAREFGHEDVFRLLMERTPDTLKLALACELGDADAFAALRAARPDLAGSLSDAERSKLVDAAEGNNTRALRLMLEAGWPTDARGSNQATALHWAAWHGNVEAVRELLAHGAAVDAEEGAYHNRPLGWAIHGSTHSWHRQTGDYDGVRDALLAAGATPL